MMEVTYFAEDMVPQLFDSELFVEKYPPSTLYEINLNDLTNISALKMTNDQLIKKQGTRQFNTKT